MEKFKPRGIYPAMMTPFDDRGEPNTAVLEQMTDFMVNAGVHGLFPVSNVGEQIHMSRGQKERVIDAAVSAAGKRVPVVPGISASTAAEAVDLGKYCKKAGATGVVLSAPFYFKYPQHVIKSFVQQVAAKVELPIILYNIPLYSSPMEFSTVESLMKIPQLVGIKDSSGSVPNLQRLIALSCGDFSVMVGWEEMLVSALVSGAQGCMTASAGIFPELMTEIYGLVTGENKDIERAVRQQANISHAASKMGSVFFPQGYKHAMAARGFNMGKPQICENPFSDSDKEKLTEINEAVKNLI